MAYKEWREKGKSASGVSSIKLNYGWQTCNSESDFVFGHPQNSLTYLEKPIYDSESCIEQIPRLH